VGVEVDLAPLEAAVAAYDVSAQAFATLQRGLAEDGSTFLGDGEGEGEGEGPADLGAIMRVNSIAIEAERDFLDPSGLPGRRYFKHVLQAPGIFLGPDCVNSVKTIFILHSVLCCCY
jgi:hypothetical protein